MAGAIIRLFEPIPIKLPNARHYNPRFIYFLPTFRSPKTFFKFFFLKILLRSSWVNIQERFLIKSGL